MAKLEPYLHFNGNAKEAMEFYKSVLGGELEFSTVGESPMADKMPDMKDKIMHATLKSGDATFMASDMFDEDKSGGGPQWGNMITLSLQCLSEDEINSLFGKLSAGGEIYHELKTEFWGATFGQFADKFGVHWMLNYDKPKQ